MSALSALAGFGSQLAAPAIGQGMSELRFNLDWNDVARERNRFHLMQRRAIGAAGNAVDLASDNFGPARLGVSQAITFYNQQPWHMAFANPEFASRFERSLQIDLAEYGINTKSIPNPDNLGSPAAQRAVAWANGQATRWQRLIEMSAASAPIGNVIHDYYRSLGVPDAQRTVSESELNFNLQRGQYRRNEDRQRLLRPFAHWNAQEVLRFEAAGLIDINAGNRMLSAAGIHHQQDFDLLMAGQSLPDISVIIAMWLRGERTEAETRKSMALAGIIKPEMQDQIFKLSYKMPSPETLSQWANVFIWNEEFARKYELDDGYDENPLATFFAGIQGVKTMPPLPGQPPGETDWFKLMFRSKNEMPSFRECLEMQRRLRPDPDRPGFGVNSNVPPWTLQETLDTMKMKGFTPFFTKSIAAALVYEPLNLRFINHLLLPFMEHPDFRARWEPVIGPPEKWVAAAMLDHGYRPEICDAAAAGIIRQGQDAADLEKKAQERALRDEKRKVAIKRYRVGTMTTAQARDEMQDRWFTQEMADEQIRLINLEVDETIAEHKVKAIHESFMAGKITYAFAQGQLQEIIILPRRVEQYMEEWAWTRTEKVKMLSTADILAAFKAGFMGRDDALFRLRNLGWNQPDAIMEIAHVERDIATAAAKTAAANATRTANEAHKAQTENDKRRKAAAVELAKEIKENARISKQVALAAHEKLLAQSEYYASVHAKNSAFEKARDKGDGEKMAALIDGQVADYHKYLLAQMKLILQGPEVANVVSPFEVIPQPGPRQAPRDSEADSAATEPAIEPADGVGGTASAPGPATPA